MDVMRQFVQSLRRLYHSGRISLEKIREYLAKGTITQEELDWIVS